ncbi:small-conductance mechanosensitive channel [Pedobacter sp. CAN_A7]|uniref:mechanosensitive ion channel family protein n=1 Tax=Pedobacter sp. CAN_A7 TaxID=2787722 RepID=UPI0018CA5633
MYKIIPFSVICCFFLLLAGNLYAQTPVKPETSKDSVKVEKTDTSINTFIDKVEFYTNSFNQMNETLSKGFDTAAIHQELPKIQRIIDYIKKGTPITDRSNTLRALYTIRDILTRQEDKLDEWQKTLGNYNESLVQIQDGLSQVKNDASLKYVPADSVLKKEYSDQLLVLNYKWNQVDSVNKQAAQRIGLMQSRVVDNFITLTAYKDSINMELRNFLTRAFSKEYPYLWQSSKSDYVKNFKSATDKTITFSRQLFNYSVTYNWNIHLFGLFLFGLFYTWILYNAAKVRRLRTEPEKIWAQVHYIVKKPWLSSVIIICIITFFIYDHPPVIFMEFVMLILMVVTGIIVRDIWPKMLFRYWLFLFCLAFLAGISNLFIQVSYADRIAVFVLCIAGAYGGWRFLKNIKNAKEFYPEKTRLFLIIFIAVQVIAVICNVMGRFSLAKILLVTSVFGIWQAMTLVIFVRILIEALFLQLEANKENTGVPTYFDFERLQQRFKHALNIIAILLWFILFAGNLNILDAFYENGLELLTKTHKLGGIEITFGSIVVFILVVWVTTAISKGVTYFFEFSDYHAASARRKNKLSSSILLIKLAIFSIGFLFAISASGIPLEKITIILGALSVGIGFGLQTIVNNLVSGVILAVEKPVGIGDTIEVGGKTGVVKEMGIRATKIATGHGSEIIVPNGDLLSEHLTNWTLSNKHRQVELVIGVAYGSDLDVVMVLLKKIVTEKEDIMQTPTPLVLVHNLSQSSVDFKITFWVDDIDNWTTLKSSVLSAVYTVFYKEGISLPFPQSDVHVHFPNNKNL